MMATATGCEHETSFPFYNSTYATIPLCSSYDYNSREEGRQGFIGNGWTRRDGDGSRARRRRLSLVNLNGLNGIGTGQHPAERQTGGAALIEKIREYDVGLQCRFPVTALTSSTSKANQKLVTPTGCNAAVTSLTPFQRQLKFIINRQQSGHFVELLCASLERTRTPVAGAAGLGRSPFNVEDRFKNGFRFLSSSSGSCHQVLKVHSRHGSPQPLPRPLSTF